MPPSGDRSTTSSSIRNDPPLLPPARMSGSFRVSLAWRPMTWTGGALHITTSPSGLRLRGEIDAHSATTLASHLDPLPVSTGDVVIDLSEVGFIDSSGLRVLVEAHQRAENEARRLVLQWPEPAGAATARDQRADAVPPRSAVDRCHRSRRQQFRRERVDQRLTHVADADPRVGAQRDDGPDGTRRRVDRSR